MDAHAGTLIRATKPSAPPSENLRDQYQTVRGRTEMLCDSLEKEDYVIQSMEDASPTRWHLAHTTWFFETFVLKEFQKDYRPFHPDFAFLFNSYYIQAGKRYSRPHRGLLSRPTVDEVYRYREYVDQHVSALLEGAIENGAIREVVTLGLHHEQQHQELLLTDIKHVFFQNPLRPAVREIPPAPRSAAPTMRWLHVPEGVYEVGHVGGAFHFDNEAPRHRVFIEPVEVASRLVTNGEFADFVEAGGYARPELWLSEGWATAERERWTHPFYWERRDDVWFEFTLDGMRELNVGAPASHLSYFEADAYARWSGACLPSEQEWEVAAGTVDMSGNFVDRGYLHPVPYPADAADEESGVQFYGDVWEWTRSHYSPYPGYRAAEGALGEYNGKFMCNQFVLRGGSCATSASHIRRTYRNFFPPYARWQFAGVRLARHI